MAPPGDIPVFEPSVRVSDYLMGFNPTSGEIEELQVNPPNLPMFKQGTVPFMGDYIDVAAAPAFVPDRQRQVGVQHRQQRRAAGLPCRLDRQPRRAAAARTATGGTTRRPG